MLWGWVGCHWRHMPFKPHSCCPLVCRGQQECVCIYVCAEWARLLGWASLRKEQRGLAACYATVVLMQLQTPDDQQPLTENLVKMTQVQRGLILQLLTANKLLKGHRIYRNCVRKRRRRECRRLWWRWRKMSRATLCVDAAGGCVIQSGYTWCWRQWPGAAE